MTYREKLQEEHPDMISDKYYGGCFLCPYDYGYTRRWACPEQIGKETTIETCTRCWDREMEVEE